MSGLRRCPPSDSFPFESTQHGNRSLARQRSRAYHGALLAQRGSSQLVAPPPCRRAKPHRPPGNESGKPHGHCYGSSASDEPPICVHLSAKDRATSESDSAHPDRTARITRCCSDVVAAGSPCDKESDGEPFAGEWSAHLARDLIATLLMGCWSCGDHVRVAGGVLAGRLGAASLYTRQGAAGAGMWDDRVLAE